MLKTVLMPIRVPEGDYCWDGKCVCEHFDNEGGHGHCQLGMSNGDRDKTGFYPKSKECLGGFCIYCREEEKYNQIGLWEILVPTMRNDGRPIHTRFHRVWDEKVKAISGGLTIMQPARGKWIAPTGDEFHERMIPVRIIATRKQIDQIIDMTMNYYEQLAILCYRISNEVILKHKEEK